MPAETATDYYANNITCPNLYESIPDIAYSHYGQHFKLFAQTNFPFGDIVEKQSVFSLSQCLDWCSTTGGCTAFSYDSTLCQCWLKVYDQTSYDTTLAETISGWSTSDTLDVLEVCPYPNLSIQNASNGAAFKIACGSDFPWGDYTPAFVSSTPDYGGFEFPYAGWHTETFDECLEMCATSHPLCRAFVYVPYPSWTWANCFLKNATDLLPGGFSATRFYSGLLQEPRNQARSDWRCRNNAVQTVSGSNGHQVEFKFSCNDFRLTKTQNNSVAALEHANDINGCLAACVEMNAKGSDDTCVGVMFDEGLEYGWANCYQLRDFGSGTVRNNYTLAYITTHEDLYHAPVGASSDNESHSRRTGAIAGGTVWGVLVFLLLALLAWIIWKKRHGRPQGNVRHKTKNSEQFLLAPIEASASTRTSSVGEQSSRSRSTFVREPSPGDSPRPPTLGAFGLEAQSMRNSLD